MGQKAQSSSRSRSRIVPPNVRSIRIAAVASVKLFKVEALKESQPAACGRRPCEAAAACDSFSSSTLKSLTAATALPDGTLTFGGRMAGAGKRFDLRAFGTATAHNDRSDLYWAKIRVTVYIIENWERGRRKSRGEAPFERGRSRGSRGGKRGKEVDSKAR